MQGSGIPLVDMGSATLELQDGGWFKLRVGATDLGTGSDTILAQIAAEALGVGPEDIKVYASDTDHSPFDVGAYAPAQPMSRAMRCSRRPWHEKVLVEAVAEKYALKPECVEFDGKNFFGPEGAMLTNLVDLSFDTLYHDRALMKTLSSTASFTGGKAPPPYMAGFAEIEVDLGTGKVKLLRYVAVVDCGTTINPNLARIQVEGGLRQGIGMALFERVVFGDRGKLMTNSLSRYAIPSREDVGEIIVEFAESYEPSGPYGVK